MSESFSAPEVIIPNLKKRFSGITSTIIQVLPHQKKLISLALIGNPLESSEVEPIAWKSLFALTRKNLPGGYPIIFHARRNDDMIVGLAMKYLLRRKMHIVFTSVAQRDHTWFTRFLYRRVDTLLSTSDRSASFLLRKPEAIIPHGTDTKTFFPASDRNSDWTKGGLPGKFGIGIFGRVRPQKGIGEFIEAMLEILPKYPDYTAVIVGQTTPEHQSFVEKLKAKIAERGLSERIVWLGKLPFDEIPRWFRRMSLVVAASRNEGFGLTCLEAMASGAPVVATQTGGFEMVIREDLDGKIVPCHDSVALNRAIADLLSDREKLEVMGRDAHARILEKFTVQREAQELAEVYRRIQKSYLPSD